MGGTQTDEELTAKFNKKTPIKSKQTSKPPKTSKTTCDKIKSNACLIVSSCIIVALSMLLSLPTRLLPILDKLSNNYVCEQPSNATIPPPVPKYILYGSNVDGGYLRHVIAVLNRLGLQRTYDLNSHWDLMWAHDFPFSELKSTLANITPYQKVNHFPGTGFITSKVDLATTKNKYIPRSFKLPQEYDELVMYANKNPNREFVQKDNKHRKIEVRKIDEIDKGDASTFVQEYITNPLLVDGHKFDIGVYTVITSVNPLRVYIYNGEILFRYCPEKYYPFDPENQDKYVVGDKYLPSWEVPELKPYHDAGFGMKKSFDAYLISQGKDPSKIWEQVEDALSSIILQKEEHIIKALSNYKYRASFFEMMRFDFILDDELNVYLLESNMSPNL